jgi:hypothetical protein
MARQRDIRSAWFTQDQAAELNHCELLGVLVTADSGARADATGRNGATADSPVELTISTPEGGSLSYQPAAPVYMPNGIYIDVGSNVTGVWMQWERWPE